MNYWRTSYCHEFLWDTITFHSHTLSQGLIFPKTLQKDSHCGGTWSRQVSTTHHSRRFRKKTSKTTRDKRDTQLIQETTSQLYISHSQNIKETILRVQTVCSLYFGPTLSICCNCDTLHLCRQPGNCKTVDTPQPPRDMSHCLMLAQQSEVIASKPRVQSNSHDLELPILFLCRVLANLFDSVLSSFSQPIWPSPPNVPDSVTSLIQVKGNNPSAK